MRLNPSEPFMTLGAHPGRVGDPPATGSSVPSQTTRGLTAIGTEHHHPGPRSPLRSTPVGCGSGAHRCHDLPFPFRCHCVRPNSNLLRDCSEPAQDLRNPGRHCGHCGRRVCRAQQCHRQRQSPPSRRCRRWSGSSSPKRRTSLGRTSGTRSLPFCRTIPCFTDPGPSLLPKLVSCLFRSNDFCKLNVFQSCDELFVALMHAANLEP